MTWGVVLRRFSVSVLVTIAAFAVGVVSGTRTGRTSRDGGS